MNQNDTQRIFRTLVNGEIVYSYSEAFRIQGLIERGDWDAAATAVTLAQRRPYDARVEEIIGLIAFYEARRSDMSVPDTVIRAAYRVDPKTAHDVTDRCDVLESFARLTNSLAHSQRWALLDEMLAYAKLHYRSGSRKVIANKILGLGKDNVPPRTRELAKQVRPLFNLAWRTPSLDKVMIDI